MGGPGSGRVAGRGSKFTTEDVCSISIGQVVSKGLLADVDSAEIDLMRYDEPELSILVHSWQTCLALISSSREDQFPAVMTQSVEIETTPCNFGGERAWFTCPCCSRRVGVLFIRNLRGSWRTGPKVACRICHKLSYPSQLEGEFDQACRRVRKIQRRLGNPDWYNTIDRSFPRPKGMHKKTYNRLLQIAGVSTEEMCKKFNWI